MKKILLGLGAAGITLAMIPLFAAFEAHVVNVTARIENALSVPVTPITFGTVFPQEQLDRVLPVTLSQSFLDQQDADDVDYIIRQKPKCGVTEQNGQVLVGPTWTGHVVVDPILDTSGVIIGYTYHVDCDKEKPANLVLQPGQSAGLLPMLCPYLSKHELTNDPVEIEEGVFADNDQELAAFHQPFTIDQSTGAIIWNDTKGRLAKSESDQADDWNIDLKVPCFGGYCAQDWAAFVHDINPNADPALYTQDIANEHKVFGCNLWIEVTGVSRLRPN